MEIVNHEYYVSLEVGKLLNLAGYDWETLGYYNKIGFFHRAIPHHGEISTPTLEVAQRWLRKVKNVVLIVDFDNDEDCEENERYGVTIYIGKERIVELATYPTYEEAQEAGIKKVLELILEKGE